MAKQFKDFTFTGKQFSSLCTKYISVDFEDNSDIPLAMERNMEIGETNLSRVEPNYFGDTWTDVLPIELNIVKDPSQYDYNQKELVITKGEIREITRWLTSPHYPEWIEFEYDHDNVDEAKYYRGWFNNVETWVVGSEVYGLKLSFKCTTPFGYTDDIVNTQTVTKYSNILVTNDSDELDSYCYPTIEIKPNSNGQIYICNLSDCKILKNGILTLTESTYFQSMLTLIEEFATLNGYTVKYTGKGAFNIVALCNDTAVQFYLIDRYNNEIKCTAFYMDDTKEYRIIEDGFMFMDVYTDLNVYIDCQKLIINDSLGRIITYDKLGITDVDHIYWLRLINGHNSLLLYGNAKFTITHKESRKVGE